MAEVPNVQVLHGDCRELMAAMPAESVDAVVTDPPYGLEFMGKEWDRPWAVSATNGVGYSGRGDLTLPSHGDNRNANCRACGGRMRGAKRCACAKPQWDRHPREDMVAFQVWFENVAVKALRVLKPGGHLLAFGGTRTYHRMACAIEDAGFEIRDSLHWLYGSGFPKSLDVSKAIDKAAGAERARQAPRRLAAPSQSLHPTGFNADGWAPQVNEPVTEDAARWSGWGTALKPAHEPIIVARKPLAGTVAANVLEHGTGALNIDGCRVPTSDPLPGAGGDRVTDNQVYGHGLGVSSGRSAELGGRWPANVIVDSAAAAELDRQSGYSVTPRKTTRGAGGKNGRYGPIGAQGVVETYGDAGGASRFFTRADLGADDWPFVYCSKPGKRERNAGLDGMPERQERTTYDKSVRDGNGNDSGYARANHHPTVKPVALMRHLVRLVTPPGGVVLDPFAGSGTTLVAAVLEGVDAVGCEMTDEYLPLIDARVAWAAEQVRSTQPTLLEASDG